MKFTKIIIALVICLLTFCGCSNIQELETTTTQEIEVEEILTMTVIDKYEDNGKYYIIGYNIEKDYLDKIIVNKEKFLSWNYGDTYTISVGFSYTV